MNVERSLNDVCIINCFDTYEHRVDLLYDFFKSIGANVRVITSDYKHFEKCKRNDSKEGFEFVKAIPYRKNLSINRLRSHSALSRKIFQMIENEEYDLLWVLVPPNSFVKGAAKYKKAHPDTKLIFDIIDLWPETMPISKFKSLPPFQYWRGLRDRFLDSADEVVTECDLYKENLPKSIDRSKIHTVYLAREILPFSSNIILPSDKIALCYLGSINNIIDISVICDIIKNLKQSKPVELHIIGDGEKQVELIDASKSAGAEVIYHGKVYDASEKQRIFDSCHYGLNIMKDSVYVGLTMKSMDYFEAGLPIINNIHGDTWDIIEKYNLGFNIEKNAFISCEYDCSTRLRVRAYFEKNFCAETFRNKIKELL